MARWRVTPFTVADDDRADEGFDYEVRFDAAANKWFVYHGARMAGMVTPSGSLWWAWALPYPGAPADQLVSLGATAEGGLFAAITAIHNYIGRCDAEREAAEALAEADGDEVGA